jgi:hypothetical protein
MTGFGIVGLGVGVGVALGLGVTAGVGAAVNVGVFDDPQAATSSATATRGSNRCRIDGLRDGSFRQERTQSSRGLTLGRGLAVSAAPSG